VAAAAAGDSAPATSSESRALLPVSAASPLSLLPDLALAHVARFLDVVSVQRLWTAVRAEGIEAAEHVAASAGRAFGPIPRATAASEEAADRLAWAGQPRRKRPTVSRGPARRRAPGA
jgi:hypothetical protein